jgi:hypothetical protein
MPRNRDAVIESPWWAAPTPIRPQRLADICNPLTEVLAVSIATPRSSEIRWTRGDRRA